MKYMKMKPSLTVVDHRYQRDLDAKRVAKMAENFLPELVGVPAVSKRPDGSYVRIDGQHRLAAAVAAGRGETPVLVEVHENLTLQQEAELFLRLNGGRKAVGAIDKYKARLEAREPFALEIQGILKKNGCRIANTGGRGVIKAVAAIEWAYHRGNLDSVIYVLRAWRDGEQDAFEGGFIRAVSAFLTAYPNADVDHLIRKLSATTTKTLLKKMNRESRELPATEGGVYVLVEIYNFGVAQRRRLLGVAHQSVAQQSMAN